MGLLNTLRFISGHPLNRGRRLESIRQFAAWQIGSRLVPGPVVADFAGGMKLLLSPGQTGATGNLYTGLHELPEMAFMLHLLRENDLFVDVGANVGSFTVLAAGVARALTIAFEPSRITFESLRANIQINQLGERVEIIRSAVGSSIGEVSFTVGGDTVNHVVANGSFGDVETVPVTTLDAALGKRSPTMLKIDVEGFESAVLDGAKATLANPALVAVIVETNGSGSRYSSDDASLHNTMTHVGFRPYVYDPFSRRLALATSPNAGGNTIYVRTLEFVASRISDAARISISGGRHI